MNLMQAVESVLMKRYADFAGRSIRSEYWYWVLFSLIASIILSIIDSIVFDRSSNGPFEIIFSLATLIPSIAVGIRRLHDIDKSGWWVLISLTIVGIIPLIYWYCQPGTPGKNNFGAPAPTKV
jgi:uncharacterized membrane protein YhaH (DUF805 family)